MVVKQTLQNSLIATSYSYSPSLHLCQICGFEPVKVFIDIFCVDYSIMKCLLFSFFSLQAKATCESSIHIFIYVAYQPLLPIFKSILAIDKYVILHISTITFLPLVYLNTLSLSHLSFYRSTLPGELRNDIYEHALTAPETIVPRLIFH